MTTLTENGAPSYKVDDIFVEIFYRSLRNTPEEKMRENVRDAWDGGRDARNRLTLLKLLFHLRWCRGGKGERNMFRIALDELIKIGGEADVVANLKNVVFFGYWRDLLFFMGTAIENEVVKVYTDQLKEDLVALENGDNVSLAAKWAPSEGKRFDRAGKVVRKFAKALGVDKVGYRKKYLVPLRKHLRIVETTLCERKWDEINYEHVPSLARVKYNDTFRKHDEERFNQYMSAVSSGEKKMNIKLVYPYQLVSKYVRGGGYSGGDSDETDVDRDLTVMWDELVKQTRKDLEEVGISTQALAVADISGSMMGTP
jgi:hypothetical protein